MVPRDRRTWSDSGQIPQNPNDWTNFGICRVVRLFRTGGIGAHRLTLRKLHVRWWHASALVMRRFLERVGAPDAILNLIPEICDTCKVCRMWAKRISMSLTIVRLATDFHLVVLWGLFHRKLLMSHLFDDAIRWTIGLILKGKSAERFIAAIMIILIRHFGQTLVLIADGEMGVATEEIAQILDRALV